MVVLLQIVVVAVAAVAVTVTRQDLCSSFIIAMCYVLLRENVKGYAGGDHFLRRKGRVGT